MGNPSQLVVKKMVEDDVGMKEERTYLENILTDITTELEEISLKWM